MESRQKRGIKPRSLRLQLILGVCLISLLIGAAASAYTFFTVRNETQGFIDEELHQIAAVVINYDMLIPKRWEGPRHRHERMFRRMQQLRRQAGLGGTDFIPDMVRLPSLSDLSTQRFDIVIAPLIGRAGDEIFVPLGVSDGIYTVLMGQKRVRVVVSSKLDGQRFMVARPLDSVAGISHEALEISIAEFALLFVLYVSLAVLAVNLMFRAVNRVAADLRRRTDNDLSPINYEDGTVPSELNAFIDALNGMFARIEESVAAKQRFIADAAHEMRTPLTALSLQAENLSAQNLSPELALKVRALQQGIRREQRLMTSLLTLARLQHRSKPVSERFNVRDIFIELLEELGPIADEKEIDFGLEGEASLEVTLPRAEFKTVIYNLCSNALKYCPSGGQVDLFMHFEPAPPATGTKAFTGGRLTVGVRDTGPGIAAEALSSVFEPFFRVKGDRERAEGTGLGLAIAKAAADRLQAEISLKNRSGGGLEAAFFLMC